MPIIIFLASMLVIALGGLAWLFSKAGRELSDTRSAKPLQVEDVFSSSAPVVQVPGGNLVDASEENSALKEEIRVLKDEAAAQASSSLEIITQLRELSERLQSELDVAAKTALERGSADQESLKHFRAESVAFQEAVAEKEQEISRLKDELLLLERMNSSEEVAKIPALQKELQEVLSSKEGMESRIGGLERALSEQEEKASALQYELTKSRAQAAGLERVCANSNRQVEDLSRQIRDINIDNDELRRRAGFLGRSMDDFKRLNMELLKREKLSRFEEEKNREQVREIERIYDGVLARLSAAGLKEEDLIER
jgi:chromosome segregation ATPase